MCLPRNSAATALVLLQHFVQGRSLAGEYLDDLVHVAVGGCSRYLMVATQSGGIGAITEPPQTEHRLPEAGQRPSIRPCATPTPLGGQRRPTNWVSSLSTSSMAR